MIHPYWFAILLLFTLSISRNQINLNSSEIFNIKEDINLHVMKEKQSLKELLWT